MADNGDEQGKSVTLQITLALLSLFGVLGAAFLGLVGVLGAAFLEDPTPILIPTYEDLEQDLDPPVSIPEDVELPTEPLVPIAKGLEKPSTQDTNYLEKSNSEDSSVVFSPSVLPMQDSDGYYLNWQNWKTWRTVPLQLNCRQTPTEQGKVISKYVANELLEADLTLGSPMNRDSGDKPWLRVRGDKGVCFVRARSRYIVPLSTSEKDSSVVSSPSVLPMQDSDGYYLDWRNWKTWRTIPLQLNCRQTPTEQGKVISRYIANELLEADLTSGSPMEFDGDAKPWLRVSGNKGACFIRARSRYIIPSAQR